MGINIYFTDSLDEVYNGFVKRDIRIEDDIIEFFWKNRGLFNNIRYFYRLEPYEEMQLSLSQIRGLSIFAIDAIKKINEIQLEGGNKNKYLRFLSELNKICEDALERNLKLISLGD